ncbi:hypothetical protein [Roseobacter sp. CCS2]|uniref:hypothetical protein n=1 Tax=Roseobacter sp. CCS2 TaxID=391593 RepID=UPI0000F3C66B|nr:hypothetical protein [Roseobacter sp. CCS2]EBA11777.1 hypothetical protein RCCS2_17651 [Roseobacter sp. CCS2]
MDRAGQTQGEQQVIRLLVQPLQRLGLAKPSTLTIKQFDEMVAELSQKLAYMSAINLEALAEISAANAGGKDRDRFPIARNILKWAADIQPPRDDASPLIRAVFAKQLGRDAIAQGWAPELLAELRQSRRWPTDYVVKVTREKGDDAVRQLQRMEDRLARGDGLPTEQLAWRERRLAVIARCTEIANLGVNG